MRCRPISIVFLCQLITWVGLTARGSCGDRHLYAPLMSSPFPEPLRQLQRESNLKLDLNAVRKSLEPTAPLAEQLRVRIELMKHLAVNTDDIAAAKIFLEVIGTDRTIPVRFYREAIQKDFDMLAVSADFIEINSLFRHLIMIRLLKSQPFLFQRFSYSALADFLFSPVIRFLFVSPDRPSPVPLIRGWEKQLVEWGVRLQAQIEHESRGIDFRALVLRFARNRSIETERAWIDALTRALEVGGDRTQIEAFAKDLGISERLPEEPPPNDGFEM